MLQIKKWCFTLTEIWPPTFSFLPFKKCCRSADCPRPTERCSPLCAARTTPHQSGAVSRGGFWSSTCNVWWRLDQDAAHRTRIPFSDHGNVWRCGTLGDRKYVGRALTSSFDRYCSNLGACDSYVRPVPAHFWTFHCTVGTHACHSRLCWSRPP